MTFQIMVANYGVIIKIARNQVYFGSQMANFWISIHPCNHPLCTPFFATDSIVIIINLFYRTCEVQRFVLVRWCIECPANCISCTYNDTAEATVCSRCDFGYGKRLSDGQCYGKYFVSGGPTNTVQPAKLDW